MKLGTVFLAIIAFSLLAFRERETSLDGQLRGISGKWERTETGGVLSLQCAAYSTRPAACVVSASVNNDEIFPEEILVNRLRGGGVLLVERCTGIDSPRWTLIYDGVSPVLLDLETGVSWRRGSEHRGWLQPLIMNAKYYSSLVAILVLSISARCLIFPRAERVPPKKYHRMVTQRGNGRINLLPLKKEQ